MKDFIYHLNYALHHTLRLVYTFIRFNLKIWLLFGVFLALSLPAFLFWEHDAFSTYWVIGVFFVIIYITILYLIYSEIPESEFVYDEEGDLYELPTREERKTFKQSTVLSAQWTVYAFFLLTTAFSTAICLFS